MEYHIKIKKALKLLGVEITVGDMVYFKTDPEQYKWIVVSAIIDDVGVYFELSKEGIRTRVSVIEITKERDINEAMGLN